MSAEILRRAAAVMRERAEAATPGPWEIRQALGDYWHITGEFGLTTVADAGPEKAGRDDAEHIAAWHPAVALAVADWLDADATVIERHELDVTISKAYAVARAYLKEQS